MTDSTKQDIREIVDNFQVQLSRSHTAEGQNYLNDQAVEALSQLIEREIIGEDEEDLGGIVYKKALRGIDANTAGMKWSEHDNAFAAGRNSLRAEQRKKLSGEEK